MTFGVQAALTFCAAYMVGSLPFGVLVARWGAGVDIRKQGSGNIGATNVARTLGARLGGLVLFLDCLKGALPTALLPLFSSAGIAERTHLAVISGVGAIIGHMFPVWLRFRGGKGVATALGVVLVIAPVASLAALAIFAASMAVTRIVSASSMLGACGFLVVELWILNPAPFSGPRWSLAVFSTVAPLLIIARHRSNLARLVRGQEPRFRFGGKGQRIKTPDG